MDNLPRTSRTVSRSDSLRVGYSSDFEFTVATSSGSRVAVGCPSGNELDREDPTGRMAVQPND